MPSDVEKTSATLLIIVKEHTRGFKETNVNVTKAILEFFLCICDYHMKALQPLMAWAVDDFVTLAIDKISDKKLSGLAKGLLSDCCLVYFPCSVVVTVATKMKSTKSPLSHEECLHWFKSFCNDFGAPSLGRGVKDIVTWLLIESQSKNAKVKKAALAVIGSLHVQLGPIFKALLISQCDDSSRDQVEKIIDAHPFDPSTSSSEWPKVSIAGKADTGTRDTRDTGNGHDSSDNAGMGFELPRFDLFANLPNDCISKMVRIIVLAGMLYFVLSGSLRT